MGLINLNVSFPVDNEGFLRRECPYCKRHFKIIVESGDEDISVDEASGEDIQSEENDESELYCPYCGQSADQSSFWTEDQVRYVKEVASQKVVKPMLENLAGDMERISKKSDFLKFKVERTKAKRPVIAPEADDMINVKPDCCSEEMKIEEDWSEDVYCVGCGRRHEMHVLT